eukprot:5365170-Pyramimonas_sp.AAC.2
MAEERASSRAASTSAAYTLELDGPSCSGASGSGSPDMLLGSPDVCCCVCGFATVIWRCTPHTTGDENRISRDRIRGGWRVLRRLLDAYTNYVYPINLKFIITGGMRHQR